MLYCKWTDIKLLDRVFPFGFPLRVCISPVEVIWFVWRFLVLKRKFNWTVFSYSGWNWNSWTPQCFRVIKACDTSNFLLGHSQTVQYFLNQPNLYHSQRPVWETSTFSVCYQIGKFIHSAIFHSSLRGSLLSHPAALFFTLIFTILLSLPPQTQLILIKMHTLTSAPDSLLLSP